MEMNASLFFYLFLFDILSLYYIFYNDRRHSLRLLRGNFFYDFPFRFARLKRDCIIEYTQHWQYRVEMCARYLRHATGNGSNSVFSLLLLFSLWLHAYTHARTHARTHTLIFFRFLRLALYRRNCAHLPNVTPDCGRLLVFEKFKIPECRWRDQREGDDEERLFPVISHFTTLSFARAAEISKMSTKIQNCINIRSLLFIPIEYTCWFYIIQSIIINSKIIRLVLISYERINVIYDGLADRSALPWLTRTTAPFY